jgi:hypothetical protein
MSLRAEWAVLRRCVAVALHLDQQRKEAIFTGHVGAPNDDREWVIVYRTADGYCCLYTGQPIEFDDLADVQSWSDEMDVRTYFIGL